MSSLSQEEDKNEHHPLISLSGRVCMGHIPSYVSRKEKGPVFTQDRAPLRKITCDACCPFPFLFHFSFPHTG